MRTSLGMIVLACTLLACDEQPLGTRVAWSELALPGKTVTLHHPTKIQIFRFRPDATVVATIGSDGPDGAVAGPILFWGEDGEFLIISRDPEALRQATHRGPTEDRTHIIEVLANPTLDDGVLKATSMSGERVSYRLSHE